MATENLVKEGTPIVWADETDYGGGAEVGGTRLTADTAGVPQRQTFVFSPPTRFGQPVVHNNTDAEDLNDVDAEEMYVRMVGIVDEFQDV